MLDMIEYSICRTQGDLYEWAAQAKLIFPDFSDLYMNSDFCRRSMDTSYSRFQLREPGEHMEFLEMEIPDICNHKYLGNEQFHEDVAYWIGFMYRYIWFGTKLPSREIVSKYPFAKMCNWYPGLHTLDEEDAYNIIIGNEPSPLTS